VEAHVGLLDMSGFALAAAYLEATEKAAVLG
jgi:hypothetical protein